MTACGCGCRTCENSDVLLAGSVAVAEEQEADEAARLLGSAEQLRATVQAPPDAFELEERDLTAATARRRLGDEGFSTAFSEGRAMSSEEAVLYASGVARKLAEE